MNKLNIVTKWVVIVFFCLCLCQKPIKPLASLEVTNEGRILGKRAVFALKTLRAIRDVERVYRRFGFGTIIDNFPPTSIELFTFNNLKTELGRGFSKSRIIDRQIFECVRSALAKRTSIVPRMLPLEFDTTGVDTIKSMGDSFYIAVRVYEAAKLDSPWTEGIDLIFSYDGMHSDSLLGIRKAVRLQDSITDLRLWKRQGESLVLVRREQTIFKPTSIYKHRVSLIPIKNEIFIFDTLEVKSAMNDSTALYLKRRDNSQRWWNSLDSSVLYNVRIDSIGGRTKFFVEIFNDSADFLVDFASYDSSLLRIVQGKSDASGRQFSSTIISQWFYNAPRQPRLAAYYRKELDGLTKDSLEYRVLGLNDTSCTLYVKFGAGASEGYPIEFFGKRRYSECWYYIRGKPEEAGRAVLISYKRKDYFNFKEPIDYVVWSYIPASAEKPLLEDALKKLPRGKLFVEARHRFGEKTAYQEWISLDTSEVLQQSYIWYNELLSTIRYDMKIEGKKVIYTCSNKSRKGTLTVSDAKMVCIDTLDTISKGWRRVVEANLDTAGNGIYIVGGIDSFVVTVDKDSLKVKPCRGDWPSIFWKRSGRHFKALCDDSVLGLLELNCSVDEASDSLWGSIESLLHKEGRKYKAVMTSGPFYNGQARLYGVLSDPNVTDVPLLMKIDLWNYNSIEEYTEEPAKNFRFE